MSHSVNHTRAQFFRYVSPHVLSMLGLSAYILADTFFVSAGLGASGLAALNLAIPVFSLINGLGLMIGVGGSSLYALRRGAGDEAGARRAFTLSLGLAAALSLVLLTGVPLAGRIAGLLGADAELLSMSRTYIRVLCAFAPAFLLNNVMVAFTRADGHPRLAMAAMLLGSFSNILLDWVMIFPMKLGMFGAVFATGLAPVWSLILLGIAARRRRPGYGLASVRGHLREGGRLAALGAPSLVVELSSGLVMLLFNQAMLRLAGNAGVAAYGVVANLALMAAAVFTGVAQGVQPLLFGAVGRGDEPALAVLLRCAMATALGLGIAIFLTGLLFPAGLVGIFAGGQGAERFVPLALYGLPRYFAAFLWMGVNVVAGAALAAIQRPGQALVLSLLRGCGLVMLWLALLTATMGLPGVWWTVPAAEATALPASLWLLGRAYGSIRQKARVLRQI